MKNLCCFCILAVFLVAVIVQAFSNPYPQQRTIIPRPVTETAHIVTHWLTENGFQIISKAEQPLDMQMEVSSKDQSWFISLTAHSPLATVVSLVPGQGGNEKQLDSFRHYLNGYTTQPGGEPDYFQGGIPARVRDQMDAIVIIRYVDTDTSVQLSGFAIDRKGIIVTTAHDLKVGYSVSVQLVSGRKTTGRIFKLDANYDLCLIQVPEVLESCISLRNGRHMPDRNDMLYALGFDRTGTARFRQGMLDGPPRRVQGLLLLQVKMNIEHGSSGSPILDSQGRLTGVVKGVLRGSNSIGFLIPFETLLYFLEKY